MAHSSEMRWPEASVKISQAAYSVLQGVMDAEETYQELLEVYDYSGATDQAMADMLFQDVNGNPDPITGSATAAQLALVADLRAAILALHQLYEAMNNGVVTQADRTAVLRRMA